MAKNLEIAYLLDFYGDVLTAKQHDVMQQYYNEDLSLAEIADNFGITRQGVRDAIKRGECILLDLEAKVGSAGRHRRTQDALRELEALVKSVRFYNETLPQRSDRVTGETGRMLEIITGLAD